MKAEAAVKPDIEGGEVSPNSEPITYRILLIEDDAGDALLVEELLADTRLSHALRWVPTLSGALAELRQATPDCILLDLKLPDASGMAAVHTLQRECPTAGVIVLTGLAESQAGAQAVANGAQDYLVKGQVDGELLRRAVRYTAYRKRAERAGVELLENRIRAEENARLERGLLPAPLLAEPAVKVTTRYLPSRDQALLGGDFFDVVQTPDGVVHAVIGDICGHGPDDAALGVCLRISWRALVLARHDGTDLLARLEQILLAESPRSDYFATCITLTLDLKAGLATIFLAGHHEPLLLAAPSTATPTAADYGTALGIAPGRHRWSPTTVPLPDEGALMLYTDGLIEGHAGPGPRRLGTDGLIGLIAEAPDHAPEALLDHLVTTARRLDAGRHSDDLAILHLSWPSSA